MKSWEVNDIVRSLIIDGVYAGVGSVASFVPIIVTLFFFLSMLEDSGYMARIAFVMDRPLRKLGLSGRSIVPLLIGFGCSVPSVMSSRTLPSMRDRKITIMLTPFMSCTAKLPIYAFFCAAFFPDNAALVMVALYLLGIIVSRYYRRNHRGTHSEEDILSWQSCAFRHGVAKLPNAVCTLYFDAPLGEEP